ncbi:helix-turn-helix domain-containing protein [Pararhodobacter zhoushanensis]|uniref:helix-turn-helix domain-containing protein n=1 Tax=Pararhodobacter zhoushanensis TaxID=2479545 RepID=UPI000F8C3E81|nr:helix-turn-helix domain-containing protein [Pararhodobacter zhoushanensis]
MQGLAVKSTLRTFEVLEFFREQRRPLRLNEIYKALNYPQSSTTNLLKSMVMTGYLNYNRKTRMYLPTMRVSSLGSWLHSVIHNDGDLRKLVDTVQARTDETVGVVAQNDLFIQYIMLKTPTHEFKMPPSEGDMRLLIDSSAGLTILSRLRDSAIEKFYRFTKYHYPRLEYFASYADLMKEIRWVRYIGHCYMPMLPTPEVASVAIPLEEEMFGIPLALGVGGLQPRIAARKEELLAIMHEAVAEFHETSRQNSSGAMAAE